jgi:hypothetical protein
MKWGVRKARAAVSKKPPEKPTKEAREAHKLRKKHPHDLTNEQLAAVNKRLNLEQNYNKLNANAIKRGTVAAGTILATAQLGVTAYNIATSPAAKAGAKALRTVAKAQKRRGQQVLYF